MLKTNQGLFVTSSIDECNKNIALTSHVDGTVKAWSCKDNMPIFQEVNMRNACIKFREYPTYFNIIFQ